MSQLNINEKSKIPEILVQDKCHGEDQYTNSFTDPDTQEKAPQGTASFGKALFMLIKAFIGTGVIFLPGS